MNIEKIPMLKAYNLNKNVNVALLFIKSCFKVFELWPSIQDVVTDIRYQALLMIGKSEFDQESTWKPPEVSVILEQIFCPHCSFNVDLDICSQKHPENESEGKLIFRDIEVYRLFSRTFFLSVLFAGTLKNANKWNVDRKSEKNAIILYYSGLQMFKL